MVDEQLKTYCCPECGHIVDGGRKTYDCPACGHLDPEGIRTRDGAAWTWPRVRAAARFVYRDQWLLAE